MKSDCNCSYISLKETGYFSSLVTDYIDQIPDLQPFYRFAPNDDGLRQAVLERKNFPVNREVLVNVLKKQYENLEPCQLVAENIELLQHENTFTVCTAHQPNLMGGYLYFIYKIMHAVKLAQHLKSQHSTNNFVPVFYIGSEDNDFDELSVFRYGNKKYKWQAELQGAVGRMHTDSLKALLDELFKTLGPPGIHLDTLKEIITTAYQQQKTIAEATQYLVNALLGQYGVVVINPDDAALKRIFIPVIKEELLQPKAFELVQKTSEELERHYKAQAFAREINLFYLKDNIRERIEKVGENWKVLNTDIVFSEKNLLEEIEANPERFSPNVILRGLYQESIFPNVAFIGGGSEVAYWLQLKSLFEYYKVFYPAIIVRQSALCISADAKRRIQQLDYSHQDIFIKKDLLQDEFVKNNAAGSLTLDTASSSMEKLIDGIKQKATEIDATLAGSAEAASSKINYQLKILEKKMFRAVKRKMDVELNRIATLRQTLFPEENLQERYDSFLQYYLSDGSSFFDCLLQGTLPYGDRFLIMEK